MPTVELPANGWAPRGYQIPAWVAMEGGKKRISCVWARRLGKDEVSLNRTAVAAFERIGNYWHLLPSALQCRKALWDAVNPTTGNRRIDDVFPKIIRESTRETDMFIRFKNGSTWQLLGSDNYRSLVGSPPVGIVFSEWAKASPQAWAYLSPILAENNGWALFISTPNGKNHAYRTHQSLLADPTAFAETIIAEATDVFTPQTLAAELTRLIDIYGTALGEALYSQEYCCSFESAVIGSVYGAEIAALKAAGRLTDIEPSSAPVHTAWDIGRTDATAIWWFQATGNEVRILDYQEDSLQDLGWYSEQVKGWKIHTELAAWAYGHERIKWGDPIQGLERRRKYSYGTHYLPHDAEHRTLSASGVSVRDILGKSLGNVHVVGDTREGLTDASRNAVIAMLRKAWVSKRAEQGLETLAEYSYRFDEEKRILSQEPIHNWASHCADSIRCLALAVPRASYSVGNAPPIPTGWDRPYELSMT